MSEADRFDELISGWLDGELTEGEERDLMNMLSESPDAFERFTEATIRDQYLCEAVMAEEAIATVELAETPDVLTFPSVRPKAVIVVAGFAAAAAILLINFFAPNPDNEGIPARVLAAEGLEIEGIEGDTKAGETIDLGRFAMSEGSLEVELNSGVSVVFHAPVEAEFESDMRLHLFSGRMNADVGERGKGFTVVTDAGEVIDLGTRFGVEADESGESRVAVFSGSVEVHPRDAEDGAMPVTLTEGQAARFSVLAGLRRWEQVAMAAKAEGLASDNYAGIVQSISDNRGNEELQPFYGLVRGAMAPGVRAFTDKPNPKWAPREGDTMPEWLEGADLIRTYHQFRMRGNYQLTLTLRESAVVYLMVKAEEQLPAWLSEQFSPTGESIIGGSFQQAITDWPEAIVGEDGLPYFEFEIWKAEAPAGEFVLGTALSPGGKQHTLMYGLAIRPANEASK